MKNIYYRGYLKSCNYNCFYCPLRKKNILSDDLKKDHIHLEMFIDKIKTMQEINNIFFVPFGEALINDYYSKEVNRIISNENIKGLGFQTNLSNKSIENLLKINQKYFDKLYIWCSFHCTETNLNDFLININTLYKKDIKFSVGTIANYEFIDILFELKKNLPENIYFWLNKYDGMKKKYDLNQVNDFLKIDKNFKMEIESKKSIFKNCLGGKDNYFINYLGDIFPCLINKNCSGNIYLDDYRKPICNNKYCNCYLSYSNREDFEMLKNFNNKFFRYQ